MSYDLYIYPERYDAAALRSYFEGRPSYREGGAQYLNEDTGVYFTLDFQEMPEEPDEGEERMRPHIAFNLNYFRPHVFGLEAEPEIRAFVERFNCSVEDPQIDGISSSVFSGEAFLKAWDSGNRSAFSIMGPRSEAPPPWGADAALIEAIWKWNFGRAALQRAAGDRVFVPKVVWVAPSPDAAPVATVTWTQGIPTIIPEELVTHLVLVRQKPTSLMKMFGFSRDKPGERSYEFKLAGMTTGLKLRGVERSQASGFAVAATPAVETLEIQAMFAGPWAPSEFRIVPPEQVCGADLVALMKKA